MIEINKSVVNDIYRVMAKLMTYAEFRDEHKVENDTIDMYVQHYSEMAREDISLRFLELECLKFVNQLLQAGDPGIMPPYHQALEIGMSNSNCNLCDVYQTLNCNVDFITDLYHMEKIEQEGSCISHTSKFL